MPIAFKRVMFLTRRVQFAIDIKQALESLGDYAVTTVSEPRNGAEQLRRQAHHLVLLDLADLPIAPPVMIEMLRARQPEIAILLAPDRPDAHELAAAYALPAVVDLPLPARALLPVIETLLAAADDALPATDQAPAIDLRQDTVPIETLVDEDPPPPEAVREWIIEAGADSEALYDPADELATTVKLAALPADDSLLDETGGTVRDLLGADEPTPAPPPAALPNQLEPPSWDSLTALLQSIDEDTDEDTALSDTRALQALYEDICASTAPPARDFAAWAQEQAKFADPPDAGAADTPLHSGDPYVAQLAVTMTQMMAELTAEATLLTRGSAILAFSGRLPLEELQSIRAAIGEDWSSAPQRARLRFIPLPGRDYMLYSTATAADCTLSLVFAGTQQLGLIRQQSARLQAALAEVPPADETDAIDEAEPPAAPDTATPAIKQPLAFVWLTADPALRLSRRLAQQLTFWLEVQLNSLGWTIHRLDVQPAFISLFADAPGDVPPDELMRDLMARSRRIARSENRDLPPNLWADAYLVLNPGRRLSAGELQRFLDFARAES